MAHVETGQIVAIERAIGMVKLGSGAIVRFAMPWDRVLEVGWRVLVTFGSNKEIVRVALDFTPIGMTEIQTCDLANVEARIDAMNADGSMTDVHRMLFRVVLQSQGSTTKDARKLRDRLERKLSGDDVLLSDKDAWGAAARVELGTLAHRDAWVALISLRGDGAKPTKKWLAAARVLVQDIGVVAFAETVRRWFGLVATRTVVRDDTNWFTPAMNDTNADALKNLVWACATIDEPKASEQLAVVVGDLAARCFTKIRGVGALSMKGGNACIYVLSQLPGLRSVAQLSRLGSRLRYKQALALVDKAKIECARRAGVEPIDLEELSLPTLGLDIAGRTRVEIGDYIAELAVVADKATLTFFDGDKCLKSVPAALKAAHAEELAELKATQKELGALVPTVRARLERWMFEPRAWTLADLRTRYVDHALVAALARRVIFATGDTSVIFFDGRPFDRHGTEVPLTDDATLSLWHPLGRPASEVTEWRSFLASIDITQPFKQVERELYLVDGEPDASGRFANRCLRQHQFAALLRERGWTYKLMGEFDGDSTPTKQLPFYDLTVELELMIPEDVEVADSGIYVHVWTDQVRFRRNGRALPLAEVPARCFSEVLRDVDLFVSGALAA